MSQLDKHLEPLELEPWRVLVVAAHPGDIESGASAAVAKWTSEGVEVIYLVATRGELSIPGVEPADAALIRSAEQSAAAAAVGVHVVDFLDIDDGTVEPTIPLRRAIVRDIRRFRPDVVMVMNHREHQPDGTLNDPDHRAVGTAALDAIGAAANQWAFRDVGEAHHVAEVLVAASPAATHAIDVSGFEADALRSFSAHEQHLAAVAAHPMADASWLASALEAGGERLTTRPVAPTEDTADAPAAAASPTAAVAVERIEYAQGRPCHSFIVEAFADPDGHARIMKLDKQKSSKTPTRARNAAASPTKPDKKSRRSKAKPAKTSPVPVGTMKLQVQLEKSGRSIGVEVPDSVMERLGSGQRPTVAVEIHDTSFETTIGTSSGRRFIAINAERRKAAGIDIDDTFFMALSTIDAAAQDEGTATDGAEAEAPVETASDPKPRRRKRASGSRSKRKPT